MKHAYMIIAHNKFEQLLYQISLLDHVDNEIYILIDKKVGSQSFHDLRRKISLSNFSSCIKIIENRVAIYWGDYSQIQAELILFENAIQGQADIYHLLSGVDLPLVGQNKIHNFFEQHKGKCFLTLVDNNVAEKNRIVDRVKYYHFFTKYSDRTVSSKILRKTLRFYRKLELSLQKMLRVNLCQKFDIVPVYASNWLSLDRETLTMLVNKKSEIKRIFKYSLLSDELFVPTMMKKYGMLDKVYYKIGTTDNPNDIQGNLRYINWWDGSPYTWTGSARDIEQLENGKALGHLFSRKFDLDRFPQLKSYISNSLDK